MSRWFSQFDFGLDPGDDYTAPPDPPDAEGGTPWEEPDPPDAEGGDAPEPWQPPPDPPDAEGGPTPPDSYEPEPQPPDAEGGHPGPNYTEPETYRVPLWQWTTAGDARVCPVCGPLDGVVWEGSDGEWPPLHGNCRCDRSIVGYVTYSRKRRQDEETVVDIDRPPPIAPSPDPPDEGGAIRRF